MSWLDARLGAFRSGKAFGAFRAGQAQGTNTFRTGQASDQGHLKQDRYVQDPQGQKLIFFVLLKISLLEL